MQMIIDITAEQRTLLRAALGITNGSRVMTQNHYLADSTDPVCAELVKMNLLTRARILPRGMVYFHVTDLGRNVALDQVAARQ